MEKKSTKDILQMRLSSCKQASRNTISSPFVGSKDEAVTYDGILQAEGHPWWPTGLGSSPASLQTLAWPPLSNVSFEAKKVADWLELPHQPPSAPKNMSYSQG